MQDDEILCWDVRNTGDVLLRLPRVRPREREFFIDNLLVRIHFIIVMIRWTDLAPRGAPHFLALPFFLLLFFFITLTPRVE